jgi:hypothetical protein
MVGLYLHSFMSSWCGALKYATLYFACCFVLVSHTNGRTKTQRVCQQGANGNSWTKRDEVTGEGRKLHNQELHNLDSSSNIITVE